MRKSLAISAVLHATAMLWGLVTFNAAPFESAEAQSIPVDFISATDFSKMTAGSKDAPTVTAPKPKVEKVAEKKPAPDAAEKITEKPEIVTASTAEPPPTPEPKKPEPKVKPVPPTAEAKPEKVEQKTDPIAEALKKEEAKKEPEQKQAEAKPTPPTPLPPKKPTPPQPKFDAAKVAALLDKREPQRQAATGEVMNTNASLGAPEGKAAELSQSELDAFRARLIKSWNPPVGFLQAGNMSITVRILLKRDRRLAGPPQVLTSGAGAMFESARDSAIRAVYRGEPFDMLRSETYESWRDMEVKFDPSLMFRG